MRQLSSIAQQSQAIWQVILLQLATYWSGEKVVWWWVHMHTHILYVYICINVTRQQAVQFNNYLFYESITSGGD